ncbi:MAG: calcium-binding protein, partial [Nostoc sp.]
NLLSGDDGNDFLSASIARNDVLGQSNAASGNNTLDGGVGNDTLLADYSSGNNLLNGGDGNDFLFVITALGNNTLDGGNGSDIIKGGNRSDTIRGGNGNDTLYGGDGTDTFAFNNYSEGVDRLYDFNATNELIQVSADNFGG